MIPQDFIQNLLGRVDIVDVVDRYVKLRKAGTNFSACCPFHNEKTPSFTVSPAKQFYHCFGCGAHGNAIGFLMEYSGLAYPEAIRALAETIGLEVPETRSKAERPAGAEAGPALATRMMDALTYYRAELKKSRTAIDYLKGRGLSGEIAARYGLGFAPDGWQNLESVFTDYGSPAMKETGLVIDSEPEAGAGGERRSRRYDRFRNRVMFPILDARGNVIGFGGRVIGEGEPKYLNSPETPLFEKGRELYGLFQARRAIRDANQVIVVEGYMDVVALAQHGVENAVATLGTATTPFHIAKLLKLADTVVFCFDGDAAGRKAAWRALEVALPGLADGKTVSFLFLPVEDDPDSFVRREGREAFQAALKTAKPLSQFLFSELASRVDLASEEGRAKLVAQATPLLSQIEAPALGAMLRKRLAELSGLEAGEVERLVPSRIPETKKPVFTKPAARRTISVESRLLSRILMAPSLAGSIPEEVVRGVGAESRALGEVRRFLSSNPAANIGQVSAYFSGTEHEKILEEALQDPLFHDAEGGELQVAEEVTDLVDRLRRDLSTRRHGELMRLLEAGTATPEQRAEYNELHARLAQAKGGNPTPEARSKP